MQKNKLSELQKKMIMLLIAAIMTIMIFVVYVLPLRARIKERAKDLETGEYELSSMQALIKKPLAEELEKLKEETTINFEKNFKTFESADKVYLIAKEHGLLISSFTPPLYTRISDDVYINSVVQPKTQGEFDAAKLVLVKKADEISHFLMAEVAVDLMIGEDEEKTYDELFDFFNDLNNIEGFGPGQKELQRYCIQIMDMKADDVVVSPYLPKDYDPEEDDADTHITFKLVFFGMEEPPIDDDGEDTANGGLVTTVNEFTNHLKKLTDKAK